MWSNVEAVDVLALYSPGATERQHFGNVADDPCLMVKFRIIMLYSIALARSISRLSLAVSPHPDLDRLLTAERLDTLMPSQIADPSIFPKCRNGL